MSISTTCSAAVGLFDNKYGKILAQSSINECIDFDSPVPAILVLMGADLYVGGCVCNIITNIRKDKKRRFPPKRPLLAIGERPTRQKIGV